MSVKVSVIDAVMGHGKTSRLMQMVKELPLSTKVVFVVPLLTETHRIAGTFPSIGSDGVENWSRPEGYQDGRVLYDDNHILKDRFFQHPLSANKDGSKLTGIKDLITKGDNIVTTHSLFLSLDQETMQQLKDRNYILIIDEALQTYREYYELKNEIGDLLEEKIVYQDEDGYTLRWNKEKTSNKLSRYKQEITLCENGSLMLIDGRVVVWELSKDILHCFKSVYIATYMFEGSYMAGFLKFNNIPYTVEKLGGCGKDFKYLITVIEDEKLNKIGDRKTALCSNSQCSSKTHNAQLKKNLSNLFNNRYKVAPEEKMWTCYKGAINNIKGKGYTNAHVPIGTKATNMYAEAYVLAYTVNLFVNPFIGKLLAHRGIEVDSTRYALSEMLQWIYRSRIRNGEPIVIYVPSKRMRYMLNDWLDGVLK